MRISDWSSDVCSSDLTLVTVEDLLPDAAAYLAVRLDPYYVDLYRVGQDAVMLLIVASILAVAVARSRRLVIRQVAAARDRASLARYFAPGTVARLTGGEQMLHEYGASRVAVLFADVVGRSEEHTSELQSLMRISYAVFCLKKKK